MSVRSACVCVAGGREAGKTNRGYVLFQHLQTGPATSVTPERKSTAALYSDPPCCFSKFRSLYFPLALLLCSCKHQCRQLLKALPFDLPSMSCVRGQIAAVSHTRYLTQSPELWAQPPCTLAPLTVSPLPSWQAQCFL